MELNFRQFIETNVPGYHLDRALGAFLSTDFTGSEAPQNFLGKALHLPSLDMMQIPADIPKLKVKGKILVVNEKDPQITIRMSPEDGSKRVWTLSFTKDEFNRITGKKPQKDLKITVEFQRRKGDKSKNYSQIQSCHCE